VDAKEQAIRELYDARARRDWEAVRVGFADEIGWHEPGEVDHSGDYRGRDEVFFGSTELFAHSAGRCAYGCL
jgi:ketosteroid isomerase-like protein